MNESEHSISFTINELKPADYPDNQIWIGKPIEFLKITHEGFYYKGERVDDIHNVYERFHEWLKASETR